MAAKRANLVEIQDKFVDEQKIDIGLSHLNVSRKIARDEIDTFEDLIDEGRHFETLSREESKVKWESQRKPSTGHQHHISSLVAGKA